jgi:hypothetical protein
MVDTVVIQSTPPATPGDHDQKMIDKVDAASNPPVEGTEGTPPEDRPQWLPEKFKSPEDMAKAYSELEAKLGQAKPADPPAADPAAPPPADPEAALADKGLDLQDFSSEFAQKGELSAESYEKLAKAGYSRQIVDQYIEGQRAVAARFETDIMSEVGGAEKYSAITAWAKANLTPQEIAAYNTAVSSGNADQAKLAALGLGAKFERANGSDPQRLLGGQGAGSAGDVFESMAQVTAAMKDPLYKNDPAFRAKIQAKLSRSNVI